MTEQEVRARVVAEGLWGRLTDATKDRLAYFSGRLEGMRQVDGWFFVKVSGREGELVVHNSKVVQLAPSVGDEVEGLMDPADGGVWFLDKVQKTTEAAV